MRAWPPHKLPGRGAVLCCPPPVPAISLTLPHAPLTLQPGPRLVDALEFLVALLHGGPAAIQERFPWEVG